MKLSSHSRAGLFVIATLGALWVAACSDDDGPNGLNGLGGGDFGGASGAKTTVGGATNQGGTVGQGGTATTGGASNVAGSGATPTAGGSTAVTVGGASSLGGSSAAGAPTAGAGGGTAACGTTKGSFPYSNTTATTATGLEGFVKGPTNNTAAVVDNVSAPGFCSDGCVHMKGSYAAGAAAFSGTVSIVKKLTGAASNLLGAKVVVKLAINNPANIPLWVTVYSVATNTVWGSWAIPTAQLANYSNTLTDFIVDIGDTGSGQNLFCAASVTDLGIMMQTANAQPTTAGTVDMYIRSIEIRPAGYVPQGTGGASSVGGSAGAAGWLTAGNAGTAGSQ